MCPMLNAGKLHITASCAILAILFKNYFKGRGRGGRGGEGGVWWFFAQLYKNSTDCFVLEVLIVDTVSRF